MSPIINKIRLYLLPLCFITLPMHAFAEGKSPFTLLQPSSGVSKNLAENYIGGSIGQLSSDFCDGLNNCQEDDTAWKIYTGVPFQGGIILEGGYVDFGEQKGTNAKGQTVGLNRSAYTTAGVIHLPYNESLSLLGKAGVAWWKSEETIAGKNQEVDGKDIFYGAGARYDLGDNLGLRAEWERFKNMGSDQINNKDFDLLSIGVTMSSL